MPIIANRPRSSRTQRTDADVPFGHGAGVAPSGGTPGPPEITGAQSGNSSIEDVRAALGHLDRALERASGNTSVASLRVGCTSLVAMWNMPELLGGFGDARPDISVAVADLDVPAQVEALLAGRIDMALGEMLPWHSELDAIVVRQRRCAIWMAAAHPLASHAAIELRMVHGVPVSIGHPEINPTYGPWVLEQLEHAGVPATIAPPVSDIPSGFRALLAGDCVALAPDAFSEQAMPGLAIRPVIDPIRYPWTVTRTRCRPSAAADAFVAWVLSGDAEQTDKPGSRTTSAV